MGRETKYIKDLTLINTSSEENFTMNDLVIFYMITGEGVLFDNEQKYLIKEEDIVLINPHHEYRITKKSADFLIVRLMLDYGFILNELNVLHTSFILNTTNETTNDYSRIRTILNQLLNEYFSNKNPFLLTSKVSFIVYLLLQDYSDGYSILSKEQNKKENDRKQQITDFIHQNYTRPLTLNEIAEKFYLTPTYLSRYFKNNFGISFLKYLNEVRLSHTLEELTYTKNTLSRIANKNGFTSVNSYNQIFKRKFGVSPSQYRKDSNETQILTEKKENLSENNIKKITAFLEKKNLEENFETNQSAYLSVDIQQKIPWKKTWDKVINVGDAALLMRSDVQNHVLYLCRELGFSYVRIWNITKMTVYFTPSEKEVQVNFDKLNRILDFLVENNLQPYLEMNNKPNQFFSTNEEMLKSGKHQILFETKTSYDNFMKKFVNHLVQRYSTKQIKNWYFEFWQDPQMNITKEKGIYYDYFEIAYNNLKSISSEVNVGGAGFILGFENHLYKKIFSIWKEKKVFPDFLSFYGYSYETEEIYGKLVGRKSIDENFLSNQISILNETLRKLGIKSPKIQISEWNYTISNRNCINDSCAQAAYIVKNSIDSIGSVETIVYWHGTDLFSEYYDTKGLVFGDSGLLSKDRIKKPSFYAFKFLSFLKKYIIAKSKNCIATVGDSGEIVLLCYNQKAFNHRYLNIKEDEVLPEQQNELFEDLDQLQLSIELKNLVAGNYVIKKKVVNEAKGSIQQLWKQMEYSENLSRDEVEYIYNSTIPYTERKKASVKETLLLTINLEPHEICLILIDKIENI